MVNIKILKLNMIPMVLIKMANIKIQVFFLNKKNINWLKNKDEFLKLYNEIIKNGEFSENINKKNVSLYDLKKIMENILNGKVDNNKMIKKNKNNL